jgi:hypothetical protein
MTLGQKITNGFLIIITSIIIAIGCTSVVYVCGGVREGISIIFLGFLIAFLLFISVMTRKQESCCVADEN